MSKFIGKPTIIDARRITGFEPVEVRGVLDLIGNAGLWLHLDDGTKYKAAPSQLALFTPQPGDVLVQDVDFEFIVPRSVFERNFWSADEFTQSVLSAAEASPAVEVVEAGADVPAADPQQEIADAFKQSV